MSNSSARDYGLAYTVLAALALLAASFALVWFYLHHKDRLQRETSYLTLPPVAISRDGHSMSATIAVRTSAADADWAARNKAALQNAAQRVLMEFDPRQVQGAQVAQGLQTLQDKLREAGNAALQAPGLQEVLLTDFLLSEGDL